jgi:hypothetical protein
MPARRAAETQACRRALKAAGDRDVGLAATVEAQTLAAIVAVPPEPYDHGPARARNQHDLAVGAHREELVFARNPPAVAVVAAILAVQLAYGMSFHGLR